MPSALWPLHGPPFRSGGGRRHPGQHCPGKTLLSTLFIATGGQEVTVTRKHPVPGGASSGREPLAPAHSGAAWSLPGQLPAELPRLWGRHSPDPPGGVGLPSSYKAPGGRSTECRDCRTGLAPRQGRGGVTFPRGARPPAPMETRSSRNGWKWCLQGTRQHLGFAPAPWRLPGSRPCPPSAVVLVPVLTGQSAAQLP